METSKILTALQRNPVTAFLDSMDPIDSISLRKKYRWKPQLNVTTACISVIHTESRGSPIFWSSGSNLCSNDVDFGDVWHHDRMKTANKCQFS